MTWDWLVQRTGKHCSIRRMEYPESQTGIFGRMESAPGLPVGSHGIVGWWAQKSGHRLAASPNWITSSGLASGVI